MKSMTAPSSKSESLRAYLCQWLAGGAGKRISCRTQSEDIKTMTDCLAQVDVALCSGRQRSPGDATLRDERQRSPEDIPLRTDEFNLFENAGQSLLRGREARGEREEILLDCGESGACLRFLLPVMGAFGLPCLFLRRGRLAERPIQPLTQTLRRQGLKISEQRTPAGESALKIRGRLQAGSYEITASRSSQFISGLLFILPLLQGKSAIFAQGRPVSSPYIDLTLGVLARFGVDYHITVDKAGRCYKWKEGTFYRPLASYEPEGDWSQAAFFFIGALLAGSPLAVKGLNSHSLQGDRKIVDLLREMGADIKVRSGPSGEEIYEIYPAPLHGIFYHAEDTPDLVPPLAAAMARAEGESRISGVSRLREKESDRLKALDLLLTSLGVETGQRRDALYIRGSGGQRLIGQSAFHFKDHRMAMMASILSLISEKPIFLRGSSCVNKSYPSFFDDVEALEWAGNLRID